jgi:hypothetical protein
MTAGLPVWVWHQLRSTKRVEGRGLSDMQPSAQGLERRGAPWSEADVALLLRLFDARRPISEIAANLQRTYFAVAMKHTKLKQQAAAEAARRASGAREIWPPQRRRAWSVSELESLETLVGEGLSNAEIALKLRRTIVSVEVRRSRIRARERAGAKAVTADRAKADPGR